MMRKSIINNTLFTLVFKKSAIFYRISSNIQNYIIKIKNKKGGHFGIDSRVTVYDTVNGFLFML